MQQTLAIIKPDAVAAGHTGPIIEHITREGFRISAMKMLNLTQREAEGFYAVHRERPFFADLTRFMSSGPVVVMVLSRPDAITTWRQLMGATDPGKAEAGSLRQKFGTDVEKNATHGSDAPETAAAEIAYFFNRLEICSSN